MQMNAKGAKTIRGLGRVFNTIDSDNNRKVDAQEFFVGINECGCNLTKDMTNQLLGHFDTDNDGNVNFDEFLVALRGKLNDCRGQAVAEAFRKFDIDGSGFINAADLKASYATSSHPRVVSGEITEDEAFLEFLANFGDKNNDGRITETEWCDYYSAVSASVDSDDYFVCLMKKSWCM
jgi:Ca2+-binding EF-hand superfamily protein